MLQSTFDEWNKDAGKLPERVSREEKKGNAPSKKKIMKHKNFRRKV